MASVQAKSISMAGGGGLGKKRITEDTEGREDTEKGGCGTFGQVRSDMMAWIYGEYCWNKVWEIAIDSFDVAAEHPGDTVVFHAPACPFPNISSAVGTGAPYRG
jgi:hypothetical protein